MAYIDNMRNIPHEMRSFNQWMLTDRRKAPLAYNWENGTTYQGSKNNPKQYLSFADACEFAEQLGLFIGYVPLATDPFTIIDLDYKDVTYTEEGTEQKKQIFEHLDGRTYIETSMSGRGAHIVVKGKIPFDFNNHDAGIEGYSNLGFVVMTGNRIGAVDSISEQPDLCEWMSSTFSVDKRERVASEVDWYREATPAELAEDQKFLDWAINWQNSAKIKEWFYAENMTERRSENDAALLQMFYKFNKNRPERDQATIRMFLRSPRAAFLSRKANPIHYLLNETLPKVKQWIENDDSQSRMTREAFGSAVDAAFAQLQKPTEAVAVLEQFTLSGQANSSPAPFLPPQTIGIVKKQADYKLMSAHELLSGKPLEWLVKGVLPDHGIAALFGASGSGKSFLALDACAAIAEGNSWFGYKVRQAAVTYICLEGEAGMSKRVRAWQKAKDRNFPTDMRFIAQPFDLRQPEQIAALASAIITQGSKDGLVVIDTLNRAAIGADENSSRDMGEIIDAIKKVQELVGGLVLMVHHSGKDAQKGMRGHSSLHAALDCAIEVVRQSETVDGIVQFTGIRYWSVAKAKDAEDGGMNYFDLNVVDLGVDSDGDPVTSCSVHAPEHDAPIGVNSDQPPGVAPISTSISKATPWKKARDKSESRPGDASRRGPNVKAGGGGKTQRSILETLQQLLGSNGEAGKDGIDPNVMCVATGLLIDKAQLLISGSGEGERKATIRKALKSLNEKEVVNWSMNQNFITFGKSGI